MAFPDTGFKGQRDDGRSHWTKDELEQASFVKRYQAPLVAFARHHWRLPPGEAEELTQDFIAHTCGAGGTSKLLTTYRRVRGRFRNYLLRAFSHHRARWQSRKDRAPAPWDPELLPEASAPGEDLSIFHRFEALTCIRAAADEIRAKLQRPEEHLLLELVYLADSERTPTCEQIAESLERTPRQVRYTRAKLLADLGRVHLSVLEAVREVLVREGLDMHETAIELEVVSRLLEPDRRSVRRSARSPD